MAAISLLEDHMTSRPAAPPPHPLAEGIDWDAVREEAAQTLSAYVKLDSSHPVGRTVETAKLIADKLAAEGIESKVYETPDPNKVNLVARLTAKNPVGKPLLLSSHMDVVQAVASDWTFDPYSGEISDGYIYGRGTLDDKGMGVMNLMTMLLLKRRASSCPATSSRSTPATRRSAARSARSSWSRTTSTTSIRSWCWTRAAAASAASTAPATSSASRSARSAPAGSR